MSPAAPTALAAPSRRAVLLGGAAFPWVGAFPCSIAPATIVIEVFGLSEAVARQAIAARWGDRVLVSAAPELLRGGSRPRSALPARSGRPLEPTLGSVLDTVVDRLARHPVLVLSSGLLWRSASPAGLRANLETLAREIGELVGLLEVAGCSHDTRVVLATDP